jgi:hypothetical protein
MLVADPGGVDEMLALQRCRMQEFRVMERSTKISEENLEGQAVYSR